MVLTHPFFNPTRIIEGHAFEEALFDVLQKRRWALVTSQGWIARGAVEKIISRCGKPISQYFNCDENPDIQTVLDVAAALKNADVYVGLGGGSVIDALKGAAVRLVHVMTRTVSKRYLNFIDIEGEVRQCIDIPLKCIRLADKFTFF